MSDGPDWEDVRRDYHDPALKTSQILEKYRITRHALDKHIKAECWTVRLSATQLIAEKRAAMSAVELVSDPAFAPVAGVVAVVATRRTPVAQRRKILERLQNTIEKKLRLLEQRLDKQEAATADQLNSADFERDTRNIGLLIKNLGQLTEIAHGQRGKRISGAAAKSASIADSALADEADRFRRDLAERLQRLVDPAGE